MESVSKPANKATCTVRIVTMEQPSRGFTNNVVDQTPWAGDTVLENFKENITAETFFGCKLTQNGIQN